MRCSCWVLAFLLRCALFPKYSLFGQGVALSSQDIASFAERQGSFAMIQGFLVKSLIWYFFDEIWGSLGENRRVWDSSSDLLWCSVWWSIYVNKAHQHIANKLCPNSAVVHTNNCPQVDEKHFLNKKIELEKIELARPEEMPTNTNRHLTDTDRHQHTPTSTDTHLTDHWHTQIDP